MPDTYRLIDDGEPSYMDGMRCQYYIAQGTDTVACVFDKTLAERITNFLNKALTQ